MARIGFRMLTIAWTVALFTCSAAAQPQGKVVPAALNQTPLDQPIQWMETAKTNYGAVKDYTCYLSSQESVNGKLLEKSVILLKMKTEPFSVHMRWIEPKKSEVQEVVFVQGKNNNKMRVKSNLFGPKLLGFMSIDVNDPRVVQHSRHTILEAGIGNMIDQCLAQWQKDRGLGKTDVSLKDFMIGTRACHRVELTRTQKNPNFYCHRTVIYLDKESKMPFRLENYDWPTPGGAVGGELLEQFSYSNIIWNKGLKDADFNK
ncbi:MAG: DUF1571 domain-containing protein [Planctomycetes bacterium]|nr:DUF1571 domain-containing protein [Planctomycetota bacterium]